MNTKTFEQFDVMTDEALSTVEGGKNNWAANVSGVLGSASFGYGIGAGLCAGTVLLTPACGYAGAKIGVAVWAGVTGATGGFK
ncbi:Blp family class II bacteriocin [Streptococcus equinus]|uniref:Blp family class II bacteriocin n=1 Tax=Streptococcus equinus TaxID=1335 RepID=UPI003C6FBF0A